MSMENIEHIEVKMDMSSNKINVECESYSCESVIIMLAAAVKAVAKDLDTSFIDILMKAAIIHEYMETVTTESIMIGFGRMNADGDKE